MISVKSGLLIKNIPVDRIRNILRIVERTGDECCMVVTGSPCWFLQKSVNGHKETPVLRESSSGDQILLMRFH